MKNFFKSRAFKVILALIVLFSGVVIGNAVSGRDSSFPSNVVGVLTSPFQSLAAMLKNGISGIGDYFTTQEELLAENQLLKEQLAALRSQMADYREAILENEQYKTILGIKEQRPDFEMIDALVISSAGGDYFNTITINKGSSHGIKKQDAVVTKDGIIGVVTEVRANFSTVRTIMSPSTNIGGFDTGSYSFGILTTTPELASQGHIKLSYLPQDSTIAVGNIVITSGQGSLYPPGLVAGIVYRVTTDAQGVTQDAVLIPAADFDNLRSVLVITGYDPDAAPVQTQPPSSPDTSSAAN